MPGIRKTLSDVGETVYDALSSPKTTLAWTATAVGAPAFVIGVLLLVVGTVGLLSPLIGHAGVIGLLALMGLAGAALGTTLPDAE